MFSVVGKLHMLIEVPAPISFFHIWIWHWVIDWPAAYALPRQAIKKVVTELHTLLILAKVSGSIARRALRADLFPMLYVVATISAPS